MPGRLPKAKMYFFEDRIGRGMAFSTSALTVEMLNYVDGMPISESVTHLPAT